MTQVRAAATGKPSQLPIIAMIRARHLAWITIVELGILRAVLAQIPVAVFLLVALLLVLCLFVLGLLAILEGTVERNVPSFFGKQTVHPAAADVAKAYEDNRTMRFADMLIALFSLSLGLDLLVHLVWHRHLWVVHSLVLEPVFGYSLATLVSFRDADQYIIPILFLITGAWASYWFLSPFRTVVVTPNSLIVTARHLFLWKRILVIRFEDITAVAVDNTLPNLLVISLKNGANMQLKVPAHRVSNANDINDREFVVAFLDTFRFNSTTWLKNDIELWRDRECTTKT